MFRIRPGQPLLIALEEIEGVYPSRDFFNLPGQYVTSVQRHLLLFPQPAFRQRVFDSGRTLAWPACFVAPDLSGFGALAVVAHQRVVLAFDVVADE